MLIRISILQNVRETLRETSRSSVIYRLKNDVNEEWFKSEAPI